jgi:hypothetical protein
VNLGLDLPAKMILTVGFLQLPKHLKSIGIIDVPHFQIDESISVVDLVILPNFANI